MVELSKRSGLIGTVHKNPKKRRLGHKKLSPFKTGLFYPEPVEARTCHGLARPDRG